MSKDPTIKAADVNDHELGEDELGSVVGGVGSQAQKQKMGGQKVDQIQKAHNMAQKGGMIDHRAHAAFGPETEEEIG